MTVKRFHETRNVGPLSVRASVVPDSINVEARTVDVQWGSETPVRRGGYWTEPFDEILSMDPANVRMGRLNGGKAPVLDSHDAYSGVEGVRGVVVKAAVNGKTGTATLRFAKAEHDAAAERMFGKIRDGIIGNLSVGYRVHKFEKQPKADPSNSKEIAVMRAVDWEPYELSPCPIGADDTVGFRAADAEQLNSCEFISTRGSTPHNAENNGMTEEEKKAAELAKREADALAAKRTADDLAVREQAKRDERDRAASIRSAVKSLGAAGEKFAAKLIEDGTEIGKARELVLNEIARVSDEVRTDITHPVGGPITGGETSREKMLRGMESALFFRGGVSAMLAVASASKIPGVAKHLKAFDASDDGGHFRSMRLSDFARECLEAAGKSTRGLTPEQMVGLAFTHTRAGEASISDFAVLLENVMYKTLLGAYAQASDLWRMFCGTDTVQDFRPSNRYRTGSFGVLDDLGEGGEYKQKAIPDGLKFAITTETKGNIIALSREAVINDDMGAITDITNKFGRAAGLSIEKAVFALLALNGGLGPTITVGGITAPLFDAQFGNVNAAGSALSVAGLDADRVIMAEQMDISNNEFLDLRPATLLVHTSLGSSAKVINEAQYDPTAGTANMRPNPMRALFSKIVDSPRLPATTRRYLFTNPGDAAAIIVAFLNGNQTPFMDQRVGWRVDGTEWKLRLDFKAQAFDPKGAVTNIGV